MNFRVTEKEKQQIEALAHAVDPLLNTSHYIRTTALNQRLATSVDLAAFRSLSKTAADLARLGNLFKLALADMNDPKTLRDLHRLMGEITTVKDEIRVIAKRLIP